MFLQYWALTINLQFAKWGLSSHCSEIWTFSTTIRIESRPVTKIWYCVVIFRLVEENDLLLHDFGMCSKIFTWRISIICFTGISSRVTGTASEYHQGIITSNNLDQKKLDIVKWLNTIYIYIEEWLTTNLQILFPNSLSSFNLESQLRWKSNPMKIYKDIAWWI